MDQQGVGSEFSCTVCPDGTEGDGSYCFGEWIYCNLITKILPHFSHHADQTFLKSIIIVIILLFINVNNNYNYTVLDVNECALPITNPLKHRCSQGCMNTPQGYNCFCYPGFTLATNERDCIGMYCYERLQ